MKNQKHTPGPWVFSKTDDYQIDQADTGRSICTYHLGSMSESQDLANARLIAAAPYMLEALETAMHKIDEFWMSIPGVPAGDSFKLLESAQNHMKVAITKARGES